MLSLFGWFSACLCRFNVKKQRKNKCQGGVYLSFYFGECVYRVSGQSLIPYIQFSYVLVIILITPLPAQSYGWSLGLKQRYPGNTRRWTSVVLMLGQLRGRWANVSAAVGRCLVFFCGKQQYQMIFKSEVIVVWLCMSHCLFSDRLIFGHPISRARYTNKQIELCLPFKWYCAL